MNDLDFRLSFSGSVSSSLTGAINNLKRSAQGLKDQFNSLNKTSGQISKLRNTKRQMDALDEAIKKGGDEGIKAQQKYDRLAETFRNLRGELRKAGVDVNNLAKAEAKIARQTASVNRRLAHEAKASKYRGMRQSAFDGGLMGIAAPAMALAAPIMAAVKYEEVMADVKKVTNLSAKEFGQLQDDVLKMSTQIPMSAQGLGDIIAAAGQSGIAKTRPELLSFAETAAKMGVAFDVSGAQAGKIMADWRSGMKLSQKEATELADQVNELSNNFNTSAADLAEIIQRQGAVAMTAGLTKEEVAALGAAMKAGGAQTEIAATGLKNFTNALTKGRMHSDTAQLAFEDMGLDVVKVAKGMQTDAQGTILKVIKAIKERVPKHEISAVVGKIFGEESKGAIMPLVKNTELLEEAFRIAGDRTKWSGSMLREYEERYKTTANAIELFKNRLNALSVTTGAIMLPTFNQMLGSVSGVADRVFDLAKAHPEAAKKIVGGTAGLLGGLAGWKAAAAGTKWVAGGLGEIYHTLSKINGMQLFKHKGLMGLGVIGALGLLAHELGMLEPMAKGFSAEIKKGSSGLLKEFNEVYKGWQEIIDGKKVKDLANWEEAGKTVGETAGKYLIKSLDFWVDFGKWVGNVAAAISLKDWKLLRSLTTQPINEALEGSVNETLGDAEYFRRKTEEAEWKNKIRKDGYFANAWENISKSTLGNLANTWVSTYSPYGPTLAVENAENYPNSARENISKTTLGNLTDIWVSTFSPYGPKPLDPNNLITGQEGYWGDAFSKARDAIKKKDEEYTRRGIELGVREMSIFPGKEPTNKVTVPVSIPPELATSMADKNAGNTNMGQEAENLKSLSETIKSLSSEFKDQVFEIKKAFKELDLEASLTAIDIPSHFIGVGWEIHEHITDGLDTTKTMLDLFKANVKSIAFDIKSSFGDIADSVGSITSELSSATSEAEKLGRALKEVETARSSKNENTVGGKTLGIPGLASGGPMRPGQPYLVGEKGPELVFPRRPGWVAHNGLTRNILGQALTGFLNSGVSGLVHFMNPFRGAAFGALSGGSFTGGIFEALLQQITAPKAARPAGRGAPGIGAIHFCPNITVSGSSSPADVERQVHRAAEQGVEYIRKQIEALWNDERRVEYGC